MCNNPFYRIDWSQGASRALLPFFLSRRNQKPEFISSETRDFCVDNGCPADLFQEIPCGRCMGCKVDYVNQWTTRCELEAQDHESVLFVTLTYDEDHVPFEIAVNPYSGEFAFVRTLVRRDYQLFMKRLRKALSKNGKPPLRQFYCGEYGDHTKRPHFHSILFGLSLDDLQILFWKTPRGKKVQHYVRGSTPYYTSPFLAKIWGKGNVLIAKANQATFRYVANYVQKKHQPPPSSDLVAYANLARLASDKSLVSCRNHSLFERLSILPRQFCGMSRRPALGFSWFQRHKLSYLADFKIDNKVKILRYFLKLYKKKEIYTQLVKDTLQKIASFSAADRQLLLSQTSLSWREYQQQREEKMRRSSEHKVREF